jgi:hypothetical protein
MVKIYIYKTLNKTEQKYRKQRNENFHDFYLELYTFTNSNIEASDRPE